MFTFVAVATTYAQSAPEPAVVISVAPVKEQMDDINYLVDASGFGQAKFLIKSQIRYITNGLDTKRPAGVFLYFEGDDPICLLYTSPSPRDGLLSRMPSSA